MSNNQHIDPEMQAFAEDLAAVFVKHGLELRSEDWIDVVPLEHSYVVINGGETLQLTNSKPLAQPKSRVVTSPTVAVASIHEAFKKQQETSNA